MAELMEKPALDGKLMVEARTWVDPATPPETDAERRRGLGRLAAVLFFSGGLLSIPANRLMSEPLPPSYVDLITLLALVSGLACVVIPWARLSNRWIHAIPIVATAEVALTVWSIDRHGSVYAWFYIYIAVWVAWAFRSRRAIASHLAFTSLASAAPLLYRHGDSDAGVRVLVSVPVLLVAAWVVTSLRERLEAGQDALRQLAGQDPLTGVGNYRTLHERLAYEITRHRRDRATFVLLLIDLDLFKEVNEQFGHAEGDRVLTEVARVLLGNVRDQDTVARQGGDEFAVFGPNTPESDAVVLANKIERGLAEMSGERQVTATISWSAYPEHGVTPTALMAHADWGLRQSKRARRTDPSA